MKSANAVVILLASLFSAIGIACSSANAGDTAGPGYVPTAGATESSTSAQSPRIARLLDGFPLWIENGDAIPVDQSLSVEVRFGPYPPTREGVLDLVLRNPADGAPIKGATVETVAHMRYMDHGVFRSTGMERTSDASAEVSYRVPLRLLMYGEWVVTVTVRSGDVEGQLDLLVVVNP